MPSIRTHDLVLADASSGSPVIGCMLARNNGRRGVTLQDYPTIAPRLLTTAELDAAQLPPEVQLSWFQNDWRAGFGGRLHRNDPKRLAYGAKIDATIEGQLRLAAELTLTTVDSNPAVYKAAGFATFQNSEPWAFIGSDVYTWDYTNKNWDKKTTTMSAGQIARNGIQYGASTYAPVWTASSDAPARFMKKASAGDTWAAGGAAADTFKYIEVADSKFFAAHWGSGSENVLKYTTDPTAGTISWTSETIGQTDSPIVGLVADGTTLLVLKTNGVWVRYASGIISNLTPEFERMAEQNNFRGAFNWNGHILLPLGTGGMMELAGGKLYDVSLKRYAPDQTGYHGRVVAIHGDPSALFVLIQNTDDTEYRLFMAKWEEFSGGTDYRWHDIGAIGYTTSVAPSPGHAALFAEGIPSGSTIHHRIHVGIEDTGYNWLPHFYPLEDPDDAELVFNDASDGTGGYATTVVWDANLANVNKLYASVDFTTDNLATPTDTTINTAEAVDISETAIDCSADPTGSIAVNDLVAIDSEYMRVSSIQVAPPLINVTRAQAGTTAATHTTATDIYRVNNHIEVRYSLDGGSYGYVTGSQATSRLTQDTQTLTLAAEATGKSISLQLHPIRGSTTTSSPIIKDFTLRAALRPSSIVSIPLTVYLADNQTLLHGGRESRVATNLAQLRSWNQGAAEVTLTKPDGTTVDCVFLPGIYKEIETSNRHKRRREYLVTMVLAQV